MLDTPRNPGRTKVFFSVLLCASVWIGPGCLSCIPGIHIEYGSAANAQTLDFGSKPNAPLPGDGQAALRLAQQLEKEAHDLTDPAQSAIRTLAAQLLRAGENAATKGAPVELIGQTLAQHRDALDALLRKTSTPGIHKTITHIISTHDPINPTDLRSVDLLVRDALALLVTHSPSPGCGWRTDTTDTAQPNKLNSVNLTIESATTLPNDLAALAVLLRNGAAHRRLGDNAKAALLELATDCDLALDQPAYTNAAHTWARAAARTLATLEALENPPSWLNMPARDRLRQDANTAITAIFDDPPHAPHALNRVATIWQLITATDALSGAAQSRPLRDAVNDLAALPDNDPRNTPQAFDSIAHAYAHALTLLSTAQYMPNPAAVVRQIRPSFKPLLTAHRRASAGVLKILPTILSRPEPMNDPAVLSAMHALEQASDDLYMPLRLNRLVTQWSDGIAKPRPVPAHGPVPVRAAAPLAEHIRALSVALGREKTADEALQALRTLSELASPALEMQGEREIRANAQPIAWTRTTGGQQGELIRALGTARKAFLESFSTDTFADRRKTDARRLRTLDAALGIMLDTVRLDTIARDWSRNKEPALNAHPAWQLTKPAADALYANLKPRVAELTAILLDKDDNRALESIQSIRKDFAAALLFARLNAQTEQHLTGPCSVLADLAFGPPAPNAWLAESRADLARICVDALEAQAATGKRAQMFLDDANRTALPLLESIGSND